MLLRTFSIRPETAVAPAAATFRKSLSILYLHTGTLSEAPKFPGDGDFGYKFEHLFRTALNLLPPSERYDAIELKMYNVRHELSEYPTASELDAACAIMIGGSEYSVYDDVPWIKELHSYVEDVRATHPHVKLIGVCWGHQLLGQVLGVPCQMVPTRELGPVRISLSPEGKALCLSVLPDHAAVNAGVLSINTNHGDEVPVIPDGCCTFASNADCNVQGFFGPAGTTDPRDVQVFGIQSHPERNKEAFQHSLDHGGHGMVLTEEQVHNLRQRSEQQAWDGPVIGALMLAIAGW